MKRPVKYFVVDAFTESAFKGNQAAVCFLEEDHERDDSWLQSLAAEFELPLTCFLNSITGSDSLHPRRFHLRWFTSTAEVVLSSWESVAELQPRTDEIMKCPGKVMIVTAAAPEGSTYDFCSRLFAPKLGLNEVKKLILHFPWAEALSNSPLTVETSQLVLLKETKHS